MTTAVRALVRALRLRPHPEGGFYRETWRAHGRIPRRALAPAYAGPRRYATSILYLLPAGARTVHVAGIALLLAACGKQAPPSAPAGGAAGSATVMAQSLVSGLSEMNFRPAEPGDGLLGRRVRHPDGKYSIQPPAGWTRTATRTAASLPVRARLAFRNAATGDFLDLGTVKGGPAALTPATLTALKDTLAKGYRAAGQNALLGTDVFRFGPFAAVQTLVTRQDTVLLQLLVFRKPGEFLEVVYGIQRTRYRTLARTVEASIASLQWP